MKLKPSCDQQTNTPFYSTVHRPLLFSSDFSVSSQPPFNRASVFIWIKLCAKHGRVQGVAIGGLWWDNMPHHTPGILCQAKRLLCFHNTFPWIQLANIQVCGDHIIAPSLTQTDHTLARQLNLKSEEAVNVMMRMYNLANLLRHSRNNQDVKVSVPEGTTGSNFYYSAFNKRFG